MEKCVDEALLPLVSVVGNVARESRFWRGNTVFRPSIWSGRLDGAFAQSCGQSWSWLSIETRVFLLVYAFLVDMSVLAY